MLIVGNWKAYIESKVKAQAVCAQAKRLAAKGVHEIVIAPPFPYLGLFATAKPAGKAGLKLAAQDVSVTVGGAETGEVTAGLLRDIGATYVIVGHSERRALGETEGIILEKVRHVLAHGMTPILCVGEKSRDEEAQYLKLIRAQVSYVFEALSPKERLATVIAYEPIWAIGKTDLEAATPADLSEMVLYIRKILGDFMPGRANQKVRILYGGSVEPENIRTLAAGTGVDGFLVGHASAEGSTFAALIKAIA